jgi:hypothetical protein
MPALTDSSSLPLWTSQHQALLDAMDVAVLLPRVRQAFDLQDSSEKADQDLLRVLLRESVLVGAVEALRVGDVQPLKVALIPQRLGSPRADVQCVYPAALSPRTLHHLALIFLGQRRRRGVGVLGYLWLWDRHGEYLLRLAEAAAHDKTPNAQATAAVVDSMVEHLLASEIEHLSTLGHDDSDGVQAGNTWEMLTNISITLTKLGATRAPAALSRILTQAADASVERAKADTEQTIQAAERAVLNKQTLDMEAALRPARRLIDHIGHRESLSVWVVQRAVAFGWALYKQNLSEPLAALCGEASTFARDLEARLSEGQAFGFQGDFADFMVLQAGASTDDALKQTLLRRALKLCPIHRNTSITLASSNLRLAGHALRTAATPFIRHETATQLIQDAQHLIDEAARLRPDHENLAAAHRALESAKKQHRL